MILALLFYTALALSLFLIVNWIGRGSVAIGYNSMELLPTSDDAPALNVSIRVATPIVFTIIAATLLYEIGWGIFVAKIYIVAIIYVVFRWIFNIAYGRRLLVNWPKEIVLGFVIIALNWIVTQHVLKNRTSLLPDHSNFISELWVLICLYLYNIINRIHIGEGQGIQRKYKHILSKANRFLKIYGGLISANTNNDKLKAIILAVMIYEDFNRPRIARGLENVIGKLGMAKTFGLMQVNSSQPISDWESVELGIKKIIAAWEREKLVIHSYNAEYNTSVGIISDYNADNDYISEVTEIADIVESRLYRGTKDKLSSAEQAPAKVPELPAIQNNATGLVIETINSAGYTYVSVAPEKEGLDWLAMPESSVSVGDRIEYPVTSPLTNFNSKTLNRTFSKIMFIPSVKRI
ncbi:MAG: hypothetical protein LWW87_10355 [Geobacteraceae bacterium]|nr:hypothetical protein [Geobacteraceae bacterium]